MQIGKYLPKQDSKPKRDGLVQGKIPKELRKAVKAQMAADRKAGIPIDWSTLFEAVAHAYLDERKKGAA